MPGEGLLLGLIIAAVIALLVYSDAKQRNLRMNPWIKSPTGWAIAVFLFALIFLPAYYITRGPTLQELYVFQKKQCVVCDETLDMFATKCSKCGSIQPKIK